MIRFLSDLIKRYRDLNWALADQSMVSGVNFITGILLARYLGIEEFGRFTLAWMAVLFVNSLQHALINSPMMSIGPKQSKAGLPAYYGAVFVQQAVFSGAAFVLLIAGVTLSAKVFPEWRVSGLALPLAAAAFAFQFQDFLRRYFFTRQRPAAAFASDALRYLGQLALLVWLFVSYPAQIDTANVLWVIALTAVIATAFSGLFVERVRWDKVVLRATALRHWRFSSWLGASALLQWTSGNLFIITVGALLGPVAVGALKAAQNLMGITHILFQGLENVAPIRAARHYHENGLGELKAYLRRLAIGGSAATAAIAGIFATAPDFWLTLVYGNIYADYGYLVRWWAVVYLLVFFGLPLRIGLRAIEHTKPVFWSYAATTVFTIAVAYPLVLWLGLTGVMGGVLITQAIMLLILWKGLRVQLSQSAL
ncbi:MAG: hypothetical protein IH995_05810 [Proteobacteria bacterium]|nr:hypothetical protein [Pseudomonadota bacterium]